jgi:hypothetical protein
MENRRNRFGALLGASIRFPSRGRPLTGRTALASRLIFIFVIIFSSSASSASSALFAGHGLDREGVL